MKSLCISIGCSFTDGEYFEKTYYEDPPKGFKFWPDIVSEYLGLKLINLGRCGTGLDHHVYTLANAIAKYGNKIDTILIGCSSWDRFMYPYAAGTTRVTPPHVSQTENDHNYELFLTKRISSPSKLYKMCILSAFTNMFVMQTLADSINAKLVLFQMLNSTAVLNTWGRKYDPSNVTRVIVDACAESTTYDLVGAHPSVMGFPFIPEIGGTIVWGNQSFQEHHSTVKKSDLIIGREFKKELNTNVDNVTKVWPHSKIDGHPNALGHQFIAEKVISHYDDVYK